MQLRRTGELRRRCKKGKLRRRCKKGNRATVGGKKNTTRSRSPHLFLRRDQPRRSRRSVRRRTRQGSSRQARRRDVMLPLLLSSPKAQAARRYISSLNRSPLSLVSCEGGRWGRGEGSGEERRTGGGGSSRDGRRRLFGGRVGSEMSVSQGWEADFYLQMGPTLVDYRWAQHCGKKIGPKDHYHMAHV